MELKTMPEFAVSSLTDTNLNSLSDTFICDMEAHEALLMSHEPEIDFQEVFGTESSHRKSLFRILIPSLIALISIGSLSAMVLQEHRHLSSSSLFPEKISLKNPPSSFN